MRADPVQQSGEGWVVLEPVPSLLISSSKSTDNSFIGDGCYFLPWILDRSLWLAVRRGTYISQRIICLLQQSNIAIDWLPTLKDGTPPVYPFHGSSRSHVKFLGLEPSSARVENDADIGRY